MDAHDRFTQSTITAMRRDIEQAHGNEVFWAGTINSDGRIISVTVGARGQADEVVVNQALSHEAHVLIHNHPSGYLEPSDADMNVAMSATETSQGFYIVNNDVSEVYVVVEPVKPKEIKKLDEEETAFFISNGGPLSRQSSHFEERKSQVELLKKICTAFNESKIGVFEAGTGVGKSYAYLIPSMLWAVDNHERVVISTGTINLQQQLIEKDIPAAQEITGKKIKAVLVKGRQNYVCMRRLSDAAMERDLFNEDTEVFDKIVDWAKTSPTGSKSDLSFLPPDSVWTRINSESDGCMGGRCRFREQCFVMKVRKEASDANLLVVNHHLLFADIESRMNGVGYEDAAVLPPYKRIVFDEAHGIEDSATSFFSETLTNFKINKQINLMYRSRRSNIAGFLVQLATISTSEDFLGKASEAAGLIKDTVSELDIVAQEILGNESSARIYAENASSFVTVLNAMERLRSAMGTFTGMVREVLENISDDDKDMPCVWESKMVLRRLDESVKLCKHFVDWSEHGDSVFWLQKVRLPPKKQGDEWTTFVQFTETPLDIAPLMNMGVFEPMSSVVCTSATLRTGTTFNYWLKRTGINFVEEDRQCTGVFDSPFPYKTNALFAVPNDAPFPSSPQFQNYIENTILRMIIAAGGRTLVLFTSYDSLRHSFNACRLQMIDAGITALKQGDDDRFRLLERFKDDRTSVLFATDSYWEGVDVPGESLSQVIIVKLPFAVPNDPVFTARSEAIEKRGGSSFMELSVPGAVIKFRQGFGRLMRRSTDYGVVTVLDRRIVENKYGRQFTTSVPMTKRLYSSTEDTISAIRHFLDR